MLEKPESPTTVTSRKAQRLAAIAGKTWVGVRELSRSDKRKKPQGNLQQGERGYDSGGKGKLVSLAHFHCGAKGQDIAWQDGLAFKRYDEVLGNAKDATGDGTRAMTPP